VGGVWWGFKPEIVRGNRKQEDLVQKCAYSGWSAGGVWVILMLISGLDLRYQRGVSVEMMRGLGYSFCF
jgi:hypothetical protein